MNTNEQSFLCPECGSYDTVSEMYVSPIFDPEKARTHVQHWITCKQCNMEVPAHIAERWDRMTID